MFRNTRGEERVDPNESVRPNRFQQISKIALKRQNGISATGALLNFVKGMLGPGFLSLPLAFKQAGLWTAFAIVFVFGFLNNFCMLQLVHASQYLCSLNGYSELRYGDVAYEACSNSFVWLQSWNRALKIFTNAMLVLLQMGVCCVSYVFIAAHLQQIIEAVDPERSLTKATCMLAIYVPLAAISCIKTMRTIVILSVIGNILMLTSFVIILTELITAPHVTSELPWITNFNGIISAAGSILYSFEGQAMVLPLENKLKHSEDMVGATGVLTTGMSLVTIVYAASGFFGYITFGETVRGSIALNLPDTLLFLGVKGMLTVIVFVGYALQQYIVVETVWPSLNELFAKKHLTASFIHIMQFVFRIFLVLISMIVAIAIPNLEQLVPFVGIVSGMILAFVLPAFIDTITFIPIMIEQHASKSKIVFRLIQNSCLALLGIFGLIIGLQSSIRDILSN